MFNATFMGDQLYWWRKLECAEKTSNLSQVADILLFSRLIPRTGLECIILWMKATDYDHYGPSTIICISNCKTKKYHTVIWIYRGLFCVQWTEVRGHFSFCCSTYTLSINMYRLLQCTFRYLNNGYDIGSLL